MKKGERERERVKKKRGREEGRERGMRTESSQRRDNCIFRDKPLGICTCTCKIGIAINWNFKLFFYLFSNTRS